MGDIVNHAARLMHAAAGDILCDEPTALVAKARLTFNLLAPIKVKGKKEPVAVFQPALIDYRTQPKRLLLKSSDEMVGRERERTLLLEKLRVLQNQKGSKIIVEGEAGIGKSRLLEDLLKQAHE